MLTRLRSPAAAARWLKAWTTGTLRTDSRAVRPGDAFIAWPGFANDGRRFVAAALEAGASTVLVEAEGIDAFGFDDARIGALPGLRAASGAIADAYFDHPTEALRVIAVTGTNGKTSSAWWCAQALTRLGQRCGVVGTLGMGEPPAAEPAATGQRALEGETAGGITSEMASAVAAASGPDAGIVPSRIVFTGLTTPDPVTLQAGFRDMLSQGLAACAIEASSIGIVQHRLAATRIEVAIFTNFTRDHLDYHGSMDAYGAAKRLLFDWPGLEAASINLDDPYGAALAKELADKGLELWTCSLVDPSARLRGEGLGYIDGGLAFTLHEGESSVEVRSTLIGDYNASNLLGVIGALRAFGIPLDDAVRAVPRLTPVPGRMQRLPVRAGEPQVVVDYAHTPDALEKAIAALRPLATARGGKLWAVFGCGGNRDASKRPLMSAIAERLADRVLLTSDNPRDEAPDAILADIAAGLAAPGAARILADRREAIAEALSQADARDVLLIAGKGHEDSQEIAGTKHPFSDAGEAARALDARRRSIAAPGSATP